SSALVVALGLRAPLAVTTFGFCVLAAALILGEYWIPTRARRASGESWPAAFKNVVFSNRRRYGGYFVHMGMLVAVLGITISTSMKTDQDGTLHSGRAAAFGRYDLCLDSV